MIGATSVDQPLNTKNKSWPHSYNQQTDGEEMQRDKSSLGNILQQ